MQIANLTEQDIINQLVIMIKWMGYKNDYPDKDFSWWYKDDAIHTYTLLQVKSLISNDIAMEHFLLEVAHKIRQFKIEFYAGWYTVSFHGETVLNKTTTLNEGLFLSISDYINKK